MLRRPTILFACLMAAGAACHAESKPISLQFCHEDQDSYPYVFKDKLGTNDRLMRLMEKQLGVTILVHVLPWKRCLFEMGKGKMDGAFPASFRSDRLEFGAYPMNGDKPDVSMRLHTSGYVLYRLKGSIVDWDGGKVINATRPIGAQFGFSVVETLKQAGVNVDDSPRSGEEALRRVLAGRFDGAALQPSTGDDLLAKHPDLGQRIERVAKPIEEKPYYLMLSHKLLKEYPAFSKKLWDTIIVIRESAEFKKIEAEY